MSRIFDPKNHDRLESRERYSLIPPHETLRRFGLTEGDTFVDIGSGTGFFSIPAARITGASGHVYAADISEEMLEHLRRKALSENIPVKILLLRGDEIPLPDLSADMTFMAFVLHEVYNHSTLLAEVKRITKQGGKFIVTDWAKVESPGGPPQDHRLDQETAEDIIRKAGFTIIETGMLNPYHYYVSAIPTL